MTPPKYDEPTASKEVDNKAKRVRTGCLTCRERHLKCDEGLPHCNNCRKSNRICKRGIRLNFIDIWSEKPPMLLSAYGTQEWKVQFLDESREIASEYQGGLQKYPKLSVEDTENHNMVTMDPRLAFDYATTVPPAPNMGHEYVTAAPPAPNMGHQSLPQVPGNVVENYQEPPQPPDLGNMYDPYFRQDPVPHQQQQHPPPSGTTVDSHQSNNSSTSGLHPGSVGSYNVGPSGAIQVADEDRKDYLDNQEETLFMQVFVEEVGLWMDSMDPHKHFSRRLPFHSLGEPMLLNAFLACGARHLTLVNEAYQEEKALHYYDTATRHLLKNLQDPNRDTVICATTAVILNVYEIMSERALQRMNHIAGARALIKECGWNARSIGVGAACFWLNVGLEVLSCLHFNWQTAWNPDDWGVDMDFSRENQNGREEIWTHRMLYIIAKVCNFRATISPPPKDPNDQEAQLRTQHRYEEWLRLKGMADAWNDGIPRTMHPMAFLYPYQTTSKSCFPEVWLIKRSTVVARLFYHTAQLLLAQINPYAPSPDPQMQDLQMRHAQMICGIVAHVKDRGVASVAIRSLAHAAEVLKDRAEQEEVLHIFEKINRETGWRIGFVYGELREKWGWRDSGMSQDQWSQTHTAARVRKETEERIRELAIEQTRQRRETILAQQSALGVQSTLQPDVQLGPDANLQPALGGSGSVNGSMSGAAASASSEKAAAGGGGGGGGAGARKKMPQGIPNPMYAKADFALPQHPYQNFWVPPIQAQVPSAWQQGLQAMGDMADGGDGYYG